jgi:hypothetical protein
MLSACAKIADPDLASQGIDATVQGRPKHIYSIVKKCVASRSVLIRCTTFAHCASWCPMCRIVMPP